MCDPAAVGGRLGIEIRGVAPAFATLRRGKPLDPRLISDRPPTCVGRDQKPPFWACNNRTGRRISTGRVVANERLMEMRIGEFLAPINEPAGAE